MAQFRTDRNQYLSDSKTIFEVVMLDEGLTASGSLIDGFGRLRTSTPFTMFDSSHRYQMNDKWTTANTGGGTIAYVQGESTVLMNVTTASGDAVVRETRRVFPYQPGKSLLGISSFKFDTPKANTVMRVGHYDANNGIYFESSNANNYIVLRSNTSGTLVETKVLQSNWNMNTFNGAFANTPASTLTLDVTKANLFFDAIEWLGVGDVACGFFVDGHPVPAHVFKNTGQANGVYMTTATLPLRYEVFNFGTANAATSMKQICSTVISEGGYQGRSRTYSIGQDLNNLTTLALANTWYPVTSIRTANTRNMAAILPTSFNILTATNNVNYKYKLIFNASLGNAVWQLHSTNNVQYDLSANNQINAGNGTDLNSGYIVQGSKPGAADIGSLEDFNIQLGHSLDGNTDIITVAAQSDQAGAKIAAIISWNDIT